MPIPKPRKDETDNDFMERCMGDEKMKEEFPDTDQRIAVCRKQLTAELAMDKFLEK